MVSLVLGEEENPSQNVQMQIAAATWRIEKNIPLQVWEHICKAKMTLSVTLQWTENSGGSW